MTLHNFKIEFHLRLKGLYPEREIQNLIQISVEHALGFSKIDILTKENEFLSNEKLSVLNTILNRLANEEPIQYILGRAEFYGSKFNVNSAVLIPRPETEELVHLVISTQTNKDNLAILDIGCGSGCIAIALKKNLPLAHVYAVDISDDALIVARQNAENNNVTISFEKLNILMKEDWLLLPMVNCIISNPPYIPESEKPKMDKNVVDFEPSLALFVPTHKPLLFYQEIAEFAKEKLLPNGSLYFEIHENFGEEVKELLLFMDFKNVKVYKDLNEKYRMVSAQL